MDSLKTYIFLLCYSSYFNIYDSIFLLSSFSRSMSRLISFFYISRPFRPVIYFFRPQIFYSFLTLIYLSAMSYLLALQSNSLWMVVKLLSCFSLNSSICSLLHMSSASCFVFDSSQLSFYIFFVQSSKNFSFSSIFRWISLSCYSSFSFILNGIESFRFVYYLSFCFFFNYSFFYCQIFFIDYLQRIFNFLMGVFGEGLSLSIFQSFDIISRSIILKEKVWLLQILGKGKGRLQNQKGVAYPLLPYAQLFLLIYL